MSKEKQKQKKPPYELLTSEAILKDLIDYKNELINNPNLAGVRLKEKLGDQDLKTMSTERFLGVLLSTKKAQVFAESEIAGNGTDWNHKELKILGGINLAVNVEIYDNGEHKPKLKTYNDEGVEIKDNPDFKAYDKPLNGKLLFTSGILLKNDHPDGATPIDYAEVIDKNGKIDQEKYNALVEKRMLPLLAHANEDAAKQGGKHAVVTMPGIGCDSFAPEELKGEMREHLDKAMQAMLEKHGEKFPNIACVHYDPFKSDYANFDGEIKGIKYQVRPYLNPLPNQSKKSQLLPPGEYEREFENCVLYKIVAWDHASLPGNDFYVNNNRQTDDGVSAAATNVIQKITGIKGTYDKETGRYLPPPPYKDWKEAVEKNNVNLIANGNVRVTLENGTTMSLQEYEMQRPSITVPNQGKQEASLVRETTGQNQDQGTSPPPNLNQNKEAQQPKVQQEIKSNPVSVQGESNANGNLTNNQQQESNTNANLEKTQHYKVSEQEKEKMSQFIREKIKIAKMAEEQEAKNTANSSVEAKMNAKLEAAKPTSPSIPMSQDNINVSNQNLGTNVQPSQTNDKKLTIMDREFYNSPQKENTAQENSQKVDETKQESLKNRIEPKPSPDNSQSSTSEEDRIRNETQKEIITAAQQGGITREELEEIKKYIKNANKDSELPLKDKIYKLIGESFPLLKSFCDKKLDEHAKQRQRVIRMQKGFSNPPKPLASSIHTPQHHSQNTLKKLSHNHDSGRS